MKSGPCTVTVFKLHFVGKKNEPIFEMLGVRVYPGMLFADTGFGDHNSVSDSVYVLSEAMAEAAGELAEMGF